LRTIDALHTLGLNKGQSVSPIHHFQSAKRDEDEFSWRDETKILPVSLIEQNAQLPAKLEEDWSGLGPLRRIEFCVRFISCTTLPRHRSFRLSVLPRLREKKAESTISSDQYKYWHVTASKKLEPVAAEITLLQERLTSFFPEHGNGRRGRRPENCGRGTRWTSLAKAAFSRTADHRPYRQNLGGSIGRLSIL
jgi:hypothetical protein